MSGGDLMAVPKTKSSGDVLALPALVQRAATALMSARSAAEVLDARDMASVAYDAAKKAARLAKAKKAHDDLITAAFRAQADALEIEAQAKRRLADEYDVAQAKGEVGRSGSRTDLVPDGDEVIPTAADVGLTRQKIQEARLIRDAPGTVRKALDQALEAGEEPTKAKVKRAVLEACPGKAAKARIAQISGKEYVISLAKGVASCMGLDMPLAPPATTMISKIEQARVSGFAGTASGLLQVSEKRSPRPSR